MRLLLTTDTVGGVWTFTQELTTGLLESGHAVALISLGRAPSVSQQLWADSLTATSPDFLFRSSDAPLEWMQSNTHAYAAAEPLLLDTIAIFQPDLLHLSQFCFGALPTHLPRLITAHSDVLTWAAACRTQALAPSPWLTRYTDLVSSGLQAATALTAPTATYRDDLRQHWPELPAAQHVIPNGRTLPTSPLPSRKLQAVTAGRLWDEAKNIASLASVTSAVPILIAGERELSPAHTTRLPPHLHFTGHLAAPDLVTLLRESSIYIAPSVYEPFGLAPLEAALCGCALVLHDIPTLRELWHDHALFYSTPGELDAHLNQLAADPDHLRTWQARALTHASQFSRTRMTSHYLALYQSLIHTETARSVA